MGDATAILCKFAVPQQFKQNFNWKRVHLKKIPIEDIRSVMNIHYHFNRINGNIPYRKHLEL